jgi:hypothetical protein
MASAYSAREIGVVEAQNEPPGPRRTNSQFNNALRALPMWIRPVGEGAKRTIGVEDISSS